MVFPGDNRSRFINSVWTETDPKLSRTLPEGLDRGVQYGKQGGRRIAAVGHRTDIGQRRPRYFGGRSEDLPFGGCSDLIRNDRGAAAGAISPQSASALDFAFTCGPDVSPLRRDEAKCRQRSFQRVLIGGFLGVIGAGRVSRSESTNMRSSVGVWQRNGRSVRPSRVNARLGRQLGQPKPRLLFHVTWQGAKLIRSGQPSPDNPDEYDKAERRLPLGFVCSFRKRFSRILLCGSPCRMRERAAGSPQRVARPSRGQRGIPAPFQALVTITRRVGAVLAAIVVWSERYAGAAARPASKYVAIRARPLPLRQIVSVRDIRFRPASFRPFDGKHRAR